MEDSWMECNVPKRMSVYCSELGINQSSKAKVA
jgi:hypothetical protein